jgi:hypothetical protein
MLLLLLHANEVHWHHDQHHHHPIEMETRISVFWPCTTTRHFNNTPGCKVQTVDRFDSSGMFTDQRDLGGKMITAFCQFCCS